MKKITIIRLRIRGLHYIKTYVTVKNVATPSCKAAGPVRAIRGL
jgi:hypothetical protein